MVQRRRGAVVYRLAGFGRRAARFGSQRLCAAWAEATMDGLRYGLVAYALRSTKIGCLAKDTRDAATDWRDCRARPTRFTRLPPDVPDYRAPWRRDQRLKLGLPRILVAFWTRR